MKITPVGNKILILEKDKELQSTDSGFAVPFSDLVEGEVVEVSSYLSSIYKVGDIVLYHKETGTRQMYNGKPHKFINGQEYPSGDVWAIITK